MDDRANRGPRPVALLFPGQGSQHDRMAAGLYGWDRVFTEEVDAVLELMGPGSARLRSDWLAEHPRISVDDVRRAQPLLFAVNYALGRTVQSWGLRPMAFLGHSAGELVAGVFAGVVSLADAAAMMTERVRCAELAPRGGMLAVAASETSVRPYLGSDVAVAAVNAPQQIMLSGPTGPLADVEALLRSEGFTLVRVPALSPFHSPAMLPVAEAVASAGASIRLRPPVARLYSGYTGDLMTAQEATSHQFWSRQLTDTVYFGAALDRLLAADAMTLVEAGPRQVLTAFARRHPEVRRSVSSVIALMPTRPGPAEADRRSLLAAASLLRDEGHRLRSGKSQGSAEAVFAE